MPLRLDDHALDQLAVLLLDVDAARELHLGGLEPGRECIADPLEIADAEHARAARRGDAELDAGARERVANSSPSSRSRSPIWRRRSWRASRSASLRTLARPPPAGETGGLTGAGPVGTLCSSSSGISPFDERGSTGRFYSPPARSDE